MLFFRVDLRVLPVGEHYRPAHDLVSEAAAQPVDGAFQPLGFDAPRLVPRKSSCAGASSGVSAEQLRPALR